MNFFWNFFRYMRTWSCKCNCMQTHGIVGWLEIWRCFMTLEKNEHSKRQSWIFFRFYFCCCHSFCTLSLSDVLSLRYSSKVYGSIVKCFQLFLRSRFVMLVPDGKIADVVKSLSEKTQSECVFIFILPNFVQSSSLNWSICAWFGLSEAQMKLYSLSSSEFENDISSKELMWPT